MKHSLLTRLAVLLVALWLPIQSGAAMAACKDMLPPDSGTPAAHDAAASHHPSGGNDSGAGDGATCDECNLCYLACAAALPASAAAMIAPAASAPAASASRQPQLFFPRQPHRPPLASA